MTVESNLKRYPLIREIETSLNAPEAFEFLKGRPFSFFLDSGMDHDRLGRYSFMGSDPFLILKSRGEEITLLRGDQQETVIGPSTLHLTLSLLSVVQ